VSREEKAPFLSQAWFSRAIDWLNADPQIAEALHGWVGDFGVVITDSHAIYVGAPIDGRLPVPTEIELAFLERKRPHYFAQASRDTWMDLLMGTLDPIAGIVGMRLVVKGKVEQVVRHLHLRGVADRWLEQLRAEL
jgi:hypothetical protein